LLSVTKKMPESRENIKAREIQIENLIKVKKFKNLNFMRELDSP
jgi:hypothetical protein